MSITASKWVRTVQVPDVIAGAVLLFLVNSHNDQTDLCCPSKKTIAAFLHCHVGTVERALNRLKSAGLISWQLVTSKTGCHNQYTLVGLSEGVTHSDRVTPSDEVTHSQGVTHSEQNNPQGLPTQNGVGVPHSERVLNTNSKEKEIYKEKDSRSAEAVAPSQPQISASLFDNQDEPNQKKKPKTAKTFPFGYTTLPDAWKTYCSEARPELKPEKMFTKFRGYWTFGRGAGTRRSEKGWNQTWFNFINREREPKGTNGYANSSAVSDIQCPIDQIVNIYHEELPTLSRVGILNDTMRQHGDIFYKTISDYCKCKDEPERLAAVRRFFHFCNDQDFLMGRVKRVNGNPVWKANFSWLINPENTINIINGNYESK